MMSVLDEESMHAVRAAYGGGTWNGFHRDSTTLAALLSRGQKDVLRGGKRIEVGLCFLVFVACLRDKWQQACGLIPNAKLPYTQAWGAWLPVPCISAYVRASHQVSRRGRPCYSGVLFLHRVILLAVVAVAQESLRSACSLLPVR